ncbi:MAG: hypothetical protein M9907_07965 [Burkholderiaceae bacterium]|nr:hypothetical protein [Burkholderiaceae bacterium]
MRALARRRHRAAQAPVDPVQDAATLETRHAAVQRLVGDADLARNRLQPGTHPVAAVAAFGVEQVNQPRLDGVQAQALALQPQSPDFAVEHPDPAHRERRIVIQRLAEFAQRDPADLGVGHDAGVAVVARRMQARLAHESAPAALHDDGLAMDSVALERDLARGHVEHERRPPAGLEQRRAPGIPPVRAARVQPRRQQLLQFDGKLAGMRAHMILIIRRSAAPGRSSA